MKVSELTPVFCDVIPNELDEGKLYISKKYGIAIHLCACGCGRKTVTPIKPEAKHGWDMYENSKGEISLRPSIGNFAGEHPYHAHYYITNNLIDFINP